MEVARRQLETGPPPNGMRPTDEGVRIFLELAAAPLGQDGKTFLYVTHDSVLAVIVGRLFNLGPGECHWPEYLDALLLWKESGSFTHFLAGTGSGFVPIRRCGRLILPRLSGAHNPVSSGPFRLL